MPFTSVPAPAFGSSGYVTPSQAAILAGVIADLQAAYSGRLRFVGADGLPLGSTPQVQVANNVAAYIRAIDQTFVSLANGVDPDIASGRMQDAIGRIFNMTRIAGVATSVQCVCSGAPGVAIPPGALAQDLLGETYVCSLGGTIGSAGAVTLQFQNRVKGPIECVADTLTQITQTVPGWASINNPDDGSIGRLTESRHEFEVRRQATIFGGSRGFVPSVLGALLKLDDVLDAYVVDNKTGTGIIVLPQATFQGQVYESGDEMGQGQIVVYHEGFSGLLFPGQTIYTFEENTTAPYGPIPPLTLADFSDDEDDYDYWNTENPGFSTNDPAPMWAGGQLVLPRSVYSAVLGGDGQDIGHTIWAKKSLGCGYTGGTSVVIYDDSPVYPDPGIPYTVRYQEPDPLTIYMTVNLKTDPNAPADAEAQIKAALVAAFAGEDGGDLTGIAKPVYAARFYACLAALGMWAKVIDIFIASFNALQIVVNGTTTASDDKLTIASSDEYLTEYPEGGGPQWQVGCMIFGPGITELTTVLSVTPPGGGGGVTCQLSGSIEDGTGVYKTLPYPSTEVHPSPSQYPVMSADDITVNFI